MRFSGLAGLLFLSVPAFAAPDGDWTTYGHDKGGMRHSPLTQITPDNVAQLEPAWVYHMKPAEPAPPPDPVEAQQRAHEGASPLPENPRFSPSQMTPLVVDGRMFITTPYARVAALDPTTGEELWVREISGPGMPSYRGVEYWEGDLEHPPRIIFGTGDGRLLAFDAATGADIPGFGENGAVNLRTDEVMNGFRAPYHMTSPPLVHDGLIFTGARVQEFPLLGASGDVRAWDVRTGRLVWTFHTIPREGEPNYGTWAPGSAEKRSGVNVWGFMTVDTERDILYLPVGGPAYDRYGGDRPGDNLYGSSLVAINARTGEYLWHYQIVRHDIWDIDLQAPPLLFEAVVDGRDIPAVAIVSKNGMLFMFNRVTGEPLHPIEDRPVPPSNVPGEIASPTQPFPTTPPLARTSFTFPDDIAQVTPELQAWCEDFFTSNNMVGTQQYQPYNLDRSGVHFPGTEGGANWGGSTFDPQSRYIFVATNNFGLVTSLVKSDGPSAYERNPFGDRFQQTDTRLQCVTPPWGLLNAVDTTTGQIAWQSVLGVSDNLPEGLQNTGRPGNGGPITTASGLLFIGFTDDARFRAFDVQNGEELWTYKLEAAAHATPVTYLGANDRQYVAITSTGGSYVESPVVSDTLTAFALPE